MQQSVYGIKISDIYDLQKCLMQTWVDFEQNVIEAAIDQWCDSLRSCMRVGGGSSEIIVICLMWFIRIFHETVNVIWCIWRLFCS